MYETGLPLLFAHVALLLLPLSFFLGVGAPSLSFASFMLKAARRGSFSLFVVVVASAACVYETGLPLLCAHVALLLLPLSFFLGVGAPSLSLAGFMFEAARRSRYSLFVVVHYQCFGGLCFGFIMALTIEISNNIRLLIYISSAELRRPLVVTEALLMLPSQALLLLCHRDNDLVILIYICIYNVQYTTNFKYLT